MDDTAGSNQTKLYRELSQVAQEIRLLTDVLDAVAASASVEDVVRIIESGIKNVLPATSWNGIELMLLDDSQRAARVFQVTSGIGDRYWNNVRSGVFAAARDLNVEVEYLAGDAAEQITQVRHAIASGTHGIAITPIDAAAVEPAFVAARNAGIPVVAFDSPPLPGSAALAYIGTDNHAAGILAGKALAQLVPAHSLVGASFDSAMAENGIERMLGVEEGLGNAPISILPPFETNYNAQSGLEQARATLAEFGEMRGAFGACASHAPQWAAAVREAGRTGEIRIVGFDLVADTINLMQNGGIHAAIAQREYDMGYRSVELLSKLRLDGIEATLAGLPASRQMTTGADIVTLERTDWSIALADYLRNTERYRAELGLRERISAHEPIRLTVIVMAEASQQSVIERYEPIVATSLIGQVMTDGRAVVAAGDGATRTHVGVPLIMHGSILGAISLTSSLENACSPYDLALLERVASALAMVIENARLFRQIERRATEIEAAYRRQDMLLQTISELSSTVVPIARGILVVPMVGTIDSHRAAMFVKTLLIAISEREARIVIIDITGVSVVDTSVAHHIMQAARAAQLLGSQVIVVGITPAVAQTIVQLGVVLPGIATFADLETGFEHALTLVGGRILYNKVGRSA